MRGALNASRCAVCHLLSTPVSLYLWLWLGLWIFPAMALAVTSPTSDANQQSGKVSPVREWRDPCLAYRWILVEDRAHPGWPRHLLRLDLPNRNSVPAEHLQPRTVTTATGAAERTQTADRKTTRSRPTPSIEIDRKRVASSALESVIRAGDRVTVEQKSSVLEASFEGIALQAAAIGESLRVRLAKAASGHGSESGNGSGSGGGWGRVVAVVAVGKGQARWLADSNAGLNANFAAGGLQP